MATRQLSDADPSGTVMGQSATDKIAFYGDTPIVQPSLTTLATAATIATIRTAVQQLQTTLRNLGLAG